jgi:apolipoprotein N-acyltransferase
VNNLSKIIQKLIILALSTTLGLLAGVIIVTPVIALANYQAQDGPIFPAPLVAFVVVVPVTFILFTFKGLLLIYEWIAKRSLGNSLLWMGVAGGFGAGLIPYWISIAPYQSRSDYRTPLAFVGLGIFLGLIVFGSDWVVNKLITFLQGSEFSRL